jgi:N-acetylglucosamine kinase-like BadF-type ATPase
MILIADSGSTKTHWCISDKQTIIYEFFTNGINPFYQTEDEIAQEIKLSVLPQVQHSISSIYFYGAGCAFDAKKIMIKNAFHLSFPKTTIEVNNDLLAAARALWGALEGIACILGTGSNSCFYNGVDIVENVSPLGFILGDEGSGAVLGKYFIGDLLKNQLPQKIKIQFFEEHKTTAEEIMENVYKKPFPNRYLAQFTKFIARHIETSPALQDLVYQCFYDFLTRNIHQYDYQTHKVSCMGSIAVHFEKTLRKAAIDCNVTLDKIIQNPMIGLVQYHQ